MQINNIIRQFRSNPTTTMVVGRNKKDAAMFREFFISGCAIQKTRYDYVRECDAFDLIVENVNPARIFFNPEVMGVRCRDITIAGEILDLDINELLANNSVVRSEEDAQMVQGWYLRAEKGCLFTTEYPCLRQMINCL